MPALTPRDRSALPRALPGAALALVLAPTLAPGPARAAEAPPLCPVKHGQVQTYDVVRSGSVIGTQTVRFTGSGEDLDVEVEIGASVELLSISVYKYHHHAHERWVHGEFAGLDSETDDDGTPRRVAVHRDPHSGELRGVVGHPAVAGPVMPASLWNSRIVTQTRVIDRETGELVPMTARQVGEDTLQIAGREVRAERFDIDGPVKGTAWYDRAGCWLRAKFNTRVDGSEVEIVRR
jgi:hypothetical protein